MTGRELAEIILRLTEQSECHTVDQVFNLLVKIEEICHDVVDEW